MDTSCINVKILEADGTCQREKGFINPPKAATEILNRLQAGGRVGTLRNSRGRSLSGSDLLNDSQQYNLELAPSEAPSVCAVDDFQTERTKQLDLAMGLVGLPSSYAKDIERQGKLASGKVCNCYRSTELPIPLSLLYSQFEQLRLRCASTAEIPLRSPRRCAMKCNVLPPKK